MKTNSIRLRLLALLLLAGAAALPGSARAAFILTLTQSGGNVVVNGTGTLNTTALTLSNFSNPPAQIYSGYALLFAGPTTFVPCWVYGGGGLTGPTSFGTGSEGASSGTGSLVGISGFNQTLWVPQDYTSGTLLTDSATFAGTFASIGFNPGTYTYTWGTGVNADSLTVTSVAPVPEPATWAAGVLVVCAGAWTMHRRRARA